MLDLVFAVRDPESWHEENMDRNPAHYSALRWLGPRTVARVQRAPAGVYYNTLVTVGSQVIHIARLAEELLLVSRPSHSLPPSLPLSCPPHPSPCSPSPSLTVTEVWCDIHGGFTDRPAALEMAVHQWQIAQAGPFYVYSRGRQ